MLFLASFGNEKDAALGFYYWHLSHQVVSTCSLFQVTITLAYCNACVSLALNLENFKYLLHQVAYASAMLTPL
jgi:hypothetical protein